MSFGVGVGKVPKSFTGRYTGPDTEMTGVGVMEAESTRALPSLQIPKKKKI